MKKNTKQTSKKEGSEAGHVLRTSKSAIVRRVAASDLAQVPEKPKKQVKRK